MGRTPYAHDATDRSCEVAVVMDVSPVESSQWCFKCWSCKFLHGGTTYGHALGQCELKGGAGAWAARPPLRRRGMRAGMGSHVDRDR